MNPALDAGCWLASCGRAGNHLGEGVIGEGVLDRRIYFGLLQLVFSTIPCRPPQWRYTLRCS
jgi:hypothetical protein